jgi:hypothetical protein
MAFASIKDAYNLLNCFETEAVYMDLQYMSPGTGHKCFFLSDQMYSGRIAGRDEFDRFRKIVLRFKALGGHLIYDVGRSGTIFLDHDIPEDKKDEAADLFEGELYEVIEIPLLKTNAKPKPETKP